MLRCGLATGGRSEPFFPEEMPALIAEEAARLWGVQRQTEETVGGDLGLDVNAAKLLKVRLASAHGPIGSNAGALEINFQTRIKLPSTAPVAVDELTYLNFRLMAANRGSRYMR